MSAEVTERQIDEAAHEALAAIYFADNSDYLSALWSVVRTLRPSLAELLERSEKRAFDLSFAIVSSYPSPPDSSAGGAAPRRGSMKKATETATTNAGETKVRPT